VRYGARRTWVAIVAIAACGCGSEDAPQWVGQIALDGSSAPNAAPDHRGAEPQPGPATQPAGPTSVVRIQVAGQWYALKADGLGSMAEMRRDLARLTDPQQKRLYRQAFVKTFYHTAQPASRPYYEALDAARRLSELNPTFAPALRCLGYALLHLTGDVVRPTQVYEAAVRTQPDYAEAHYMLALLLAMGRRRAEGATHLARARELGLPDYYDLAGRLYRAQATQPETSGATD